MPTPPFIDVHILQTVPPANLNRDDQGNPKEAIFGGVRRSRVSSQAWKRATRMHFAKHLPEADLGTRTRQIAADLARRIERRTKLGNEQSARLGAALAAQLGIKAGKKAGDTAYLLFVGNRQLDAVVDLIAARADELAGLDDAALTATVAELPVREQFAGGHPVDVALFGRMVAEIPALNVDAAVQVAHALSTHATELEFDYYTAVDDLNKREETSGVGMIGTIGFNSATLYRYAAISLEKLRENLGETQAVLEAVDLFVDSFARSVPTGYGNSFAHRTRPSLLAVAVREDQPVNLVSAFEKPVTSARGGIAELSARRLAEEHLRGCAQWGDAPTYTAVTHAFDPANTPQIAEAFGASTSFPELRTALLDHLRSHDLK
ncbi:type I-E CRISPR-associated protein Cas7/Cse4/CasC [Nocardia farcinica]|uniref:type I-E CRISPR-associated protein Cas7/Cse4/CasC n=1 Tax=Nocardia farcinica TaxID=37329 RepID=UPI001892FF72|nr:type I-E CRISPR-associated protein Cas7/Cse4/CasC [Nocardia farcinica]MBF6189037.1 type I-E CRISPR-associated protein Cas7/Cse4/CasC [Nocardia farcinica]MBF6410790.1 type I-E CRISPR-associated protein Cas7/Cse4/CasC [Nocardia farcinica]